MTSDLHHRARPSRPRVRAGLAVLALAALSGCATVPSGGPVVEGAGGDTGATASDGRYVRQLPPGPQPGITPEGLVRGFLKGMGSFEENHGAAREYLAARPSAEWNPNGPVLVYEDADELTIDRLTGDEGDTARVRLLSTRMATIDGSGQYLPADGELIDVTFDLVRNDDGEWRISNPPDQLILSRSDVDLAYRPLNLYFFNRDRSTLVPDPVFLPVSSDRSAPRLVKMLVDGPTSWLRPAVESAFPDGANADVAYDSGTVTVEIDTPADGAEERFGMGAQLVWTLRQLPEVEELILRVGGEEIEIPGEEGENLLTGGGDWESVNPSGVTGNLRAYFVRDGQMWALESDALDSLPQEARVQGAAGLGDVPLERHAVSLDEDQVAGISAEDDAVVVAGTGQDSEYATVLSGGEYTALSWDGYGNLWVAEDVSEGAASDEEDEEQAVEEDTERGDPPASPSPSGAESGDPGTRLWMLRGGTDPVEVSAPELADVVVTQLRMSRDGTRAAVISEDGRGGAPELAVGRVVHSRGGVQLGDALPLATELDEVSDVSWRSGDQLVVLGRDGRGADQGYLVSLDGSTETTSAGAPPGTDMVAVTAAPGLPLLSSVEDDHIWMTNDRITWQRVIDGTNPVYPG
ncbi:hypothetical protein HNR12_002349 [Streptomonospora nanhaiensis]|uniref:Lipoprotein LpqB n=1 Tax=Streptomonospora nanhaiensis TaxID=1323731 RepID=A0A853BNP7_9ACTN|nr:LpqB family beta-propeller domain-containing protein [Streptomonospora nanhaiensis]NYI96072.1 hypothetical protein [Streptomonospora nanhaiensis]